MITLYSTNCPKCKVLETKLKAKNIEYDTIFNFDSIIAKGIKSAPVLQLEDGNLLLFREAVEWVNSQ